MNGSYFGEKGESDTPIVSDGVFGGPSHYNAQGGAMVDKGGTVQLVDLKGKDWKQEITDAEDAMVSYPMLIDASGETRTAPESHWLSNRTFLGQDGEGRIFVGTSKEAFFSLARLAAFLKTAPLDLHLALNLDGGPVSCRSVRMRGADMKFYAKGESQYKDGKAQLLSSIFQSTHYGLPMILAVERR